MQKCGKQEIVWKKSKLSSEKTVLAHMGGKTVL